MCIITQHHSFPLINIHATKIVFQVNHIHINFSDVVLLIRTKLNHKEHYWGYLSNFNLKLFSLITLKRQNDNREALTTTELYPDGVGDQCSFSFYILKFVSQLLSASLAASKTSSP